MLKILPFLFLFVCHAEARDRIDQLSVGASGGFATPSFLGSETLRKQLDAGFPKATIFGRYYHAHSQVGVELAADYFQLGNSSLASKSISLGLLWRGLPNANVHPIISAAFGVTRMQSFFRAGDSDQPMHRLRVGAEWEILPNFDLALHLDHFTVFKDNVLDQNLHVLAPSIGIIFYFPAGNPAEPAPANSIAAPVSDKDSDGDGVLDSADLCKGTVPGAQVNAVGCAVKQSFEQQIRLSFGSNVSTVAAYDRAAFAGLAKVLAENSDMSAEIQGHTDSAGGAKKNQKLSQARADSVRQLFTDEFKVNPAQLKAKGYGSSQPVDTNNNPQGRSNNRRVVVKLSR